jgi:20S proteasome subunit alpha 7
LCLISLLSFSIYKLHDEVKDKDFELELSWVTDATGRKHVFIPEDLRQDAIKKAIEAKDREDDEE